MKNKNHYIAIPVVIIILAITFYLKNSTSKQITESLPQKTTKIKKKILPKPLFSHKDQDSDINEKTNESHRKHRKFLRKKKSLEIKLPLNNVQIKKDSEKNSLIEFTFKNKLVGFKGDLDAIEQSVTDSDSKDYLISLEPYAANTTNYIKRVSFNDLKAGLSHLFKVKLKESRPEPFALTICRDKSSSNTCLNKKFEDISKIITDELGKKEDYIYYYQAVIIHDKKIQMINDPRISERNYHDLTEYLKLYGHPKEFAKQTAEKIKIFNKKIISIPVIISGKSLSVELPYQDKNTRKTLNLDVKAKNR